MGDFCERDGDHGRRLLTSIIDDRAAINPLKPFMSIPAGSKVTHGQKDLSYGTMARAINRCAWWMRNTLGERIGCPLISTYMHPMDIRHSILALGAVKSGYQMFYSSPRNRPEVQIQMLEQLGCTLVLMPQEGSELMNSVLEHLAMEIFILPELDWFLANDSVEPFPYYKSFEEACNDTYLVLHSSGTTGTPKILVLKQGSVAALDAFQLFPSLDERPWVVSSWCGKRVVTNFPWVHAGGAYMLAMCVFVDFVPVVPAAWPFSATDGDYLHTHSNVQAAWYAPSVLIELAKDPTMLKNLGKLDSIAYSGGVIPDHVGDDIARFTTVFGIMASTETGILPCEIPPSDRWDHYRFNKRLGHEFRHFADDMYELVLSRNSDFQSFQAVFFTLSDAQTYSMRDLYIEHPTHRGWWRSAGRVDDVVIMADAKKLNVVPYEAVIEQHPAVENALICGTGQPRPAVLIQPKCWPGTKEDEYQFINTLQPQLEKANCAGPVYGRLIKELVVLAQPSKPMERAAGKDTVQRKRTLEMYESEIREIYEQAERSGLLYGEASKNGLLI